MTHNEEQIRSLEQNVDTQSAPVQSESLDPALAQVEGLVEDRVSEVAPQINENHSKGSGAQHDAGQQDGHKKDDSALKDERTILKEKLLASAPKASQMKSEVKTQLEKKRERIETEIKKHRKKREYHLLSDAIRRLREVVRQLEDLAKASFEQLQDMWLSVKHKFV